MKHYLFFLLLAFPFWGIGQKKCTPCDEFRKFLKQSTLMSDKVGFYSISDETLTQRIGKDDILSEFERKYIDLGTKCLKGMSGEKAIKILGNSIGTPKTVNTNPPQIQYMYQYQGQFDGVYYRYWTTLQIDKNIKKIKYITYSLTNAGGQKIALMVQ